MLLLASWQNSDEMHIEVVYQFLPVFRKENTLALFEWQKTSMGKFLIPRSNKLHILCIDSA